MKSLLLTVALAVGVLGASSSAFSLSSAAPTTVVVKIANFVYTPATVTIEAGQSVEWINEDSAPHTATAKGTFDSGSLEKGHTFKHTFAKAGTYAITCNFHRGMKGTVIVK